MGTAVYPVFATGGLKRDGSESIFATCKPLALPPHPLLTPIFPHLYLGHGAAPPGAIKHDAACGRVGAFKLATRALDGTQQVVICGKHDPAFQLSQ
jgi:hypothetical protein